MKLHMNLLAGMPLAIAGFLAPHSATAAAFTAGDVVVYRVGDGSAALSSASTAAFLDEYTPAGTLVQTVALPTTASGANKQCTAAGSTSSEGFITRSADGTYLVGACYATATGTAAVAGTTGAAVNRVVFRADANANLDTTTAFTDFASGGNPRSAASSDGTSFWFSGSAGGVHYATFGTTGTSTAISTSPVANIRGTEIYGGQLYISSGSGTTRVATVGSGLPTTTGQTETNLPGFPTTGSPYAFVLLDLDAGVAGVDTLYVADDTTTTGGILKYSLASGTWVSNGSIGPAADAYRGLTASVTGSTVTLFATSAGKLVTVTDTGGYGAVPSTLTTTTIATVATNTAFRGVAFAPASPAPTLTVSAPASIPEGDVGTSTANFSVTLDKPAPAGGVTFTINTADGSATTADSDYVAIVNGSGSIAAGNTSTTIPVTINGDTVVEGDETFSVNLSSITNTTNSIASATGTILNDDASPVPTLSINDISHNEGDAGTTTFSFTVTLSAASASDVTFNIATADGTASAGSDYVANSVVGATIPANSTTYTFDVSVNGDTTVEANETFFVNLTNPVGATIADAQGVGTIVNDDAYTIMQIQGHGTASPMVGQTVTTLNNIVAAKKSNGFFMQDPVGDGDLTTSDGIFVFTSSAPTVSVGDSVNVTGKVQEFSGSTELVAPLTITTNSSGNALPAAYELATNPPTNDPTTGICVGGNSTIPNPPAASDGYQASNYACLDGMLVTMQNAIVTGSTFAQGQDGVHTGTPRQTWAKLNDGAPHPLRATGALWPGLGGSIPVWNGEPEVITIFYNGLAGFTGPALNDGSTFSVTGIMQGFTATGATSPIYELYPSSLTTINAVAATSEVQVVPDSAAGTLTVGSQNLLHFFNATADGADTSGYNDTCTGTGVSDSCPTSAEYSARVSKWAKVVCNELKAPIVMDLEEIENLSVARDLAAQAFSECGVSYVAYVIPGNDVSGINIGLLVRSDVVVSSVTQMYKGTLTTNTSQTAGCTPNCTAPLNDRPPVLLRASWNGYPFALLAIYDRSLSGLGDPTKPYIGPKRAEQAAQIAQIAQALQSGGTILGAGDAQQDANGTITTGSFNITGDASVPLIVAGDFNAYEFTDGYADVTGMIKGTAVQAQNLYWYNGNAADVDTPPYLAPSPTLVDSGEFSAPGQRYSYNFSGLRQEIDHMLLSRRAWQDFVSTGNAHGDADSSGGDPAVLDGNTPARSGDHDGQVITLTIDRIFADQHDGFGNQP